MHGDSNPDGPLTLKEATKMAAALTADQGSFYDDFTTKFFSAGGELKVSEGERQMALALCKQADKRAALACTADRATPTSRRDPGQRTLHSRGSAARLQCESCGGVESRSARLRGAIVRELTTTV